MQNAIIITILLFLSSCKDKNIDWSEKLYDIGLYLKYSPEQPIEFSHKVHEDSDMDCSYCHNKKHKTNDVNVCLNCHK